MSRKMQGSLNPEITIEDVEISIKQLREMFKQAIESIAIYLRGFKQNNCILINPESQIYYRIAPLQNFENCFNLAL